MTGYELAKEKYAAWGVDTEAAMEQLKKVPVSLHCWQLDDVMGFDNDGALTGGIQTTGNYPGRAKTPEQLMADMEEAMKNARPERVFITHSGSAPEIVDKVRAYLNDLHVFHEILETRAGGVVSSHCGPGTLGVLFIAKE